MSTIVTRAGKGSALTHSEVDANFVNLNTDKIEAAQTVTLTNKTLGSGTAITAGTINGATIGATTPSTGSFTSLTDSGNLTFTGTGNRITGDFSNATLNNRVIFQSSLTNGNTVVSFAPSGSNSISALVVSNASDLTNASYGNLQANSATEIAIRSDRYGTGTYLPMTFYTGGSERMRIDTSGNVGIGTISPNFSGYGTTNLTVSGGTTIQGVLELVGTRADVSGGAVGDINFFANSNSAGNKRIAAIQGITDGSTANNRGGAFLFNTKADGGSLLERMRIDSNGNVGIGTSSPSSYGKLVSLGGDNATLFAAVGATNMLRVQGYNSTYVGTVLEAVNLAQSANTPMFVNASELKFGISGTERARIDSSGNLLVGQTSTNAAALGASLSTNDGTNQWRLSVGNAASTNAGFGLSVYSTGAAAYRFYVGMAGTIFATSTTISAISDQRFKENIRDLDTGLDAVMALKPRLYDWKQGKGADVKNARGFIAQEFEQVFPDLIDEWADPAPEGEEPYKSVRQDLIPVLVKAIQEQQAMIEELKAKVAALEVK